MCDGALGLWWAVRDVWPETKEQRCWVHRLKNVLDKVPKWLQAKAKRALHEIMYADCREEAEAEVERFVEDCGAKRPKTVESLRRDRTACSALRLSGRALAAPADRQRGRIDLHHRAPTPAGHQGRRLTDQGPAHGLQTARHGPETLATSHCAAPRRSRKRRSTIHRRHSGQEPCRINSPIHNFRQYYGNPLPPTMRS